MVGEGDSQRTTSSIRELLFPKTYRDVKRLVLEPQILNKSSKLFNCYSTSSQLGARVLVGESGDA
jgi:hypothetical protein